MKIAVIGGGISGLTAAYRLRTLLGQRAQLTIYDAASRLGGKLHTTTLDRAPVDVGAEAFLVRRPEAVQLVTELGLGDQLEHPASARPKVRAGGRTVPLPSGTVLGIPGDPDAVADVLTCEGLAAAAREQQLAAPRLPDGDIDLGTFLRDRFGDELVDRLVDPLLSGVYGGGADGLGLRAVLPGLAAAIGAGTPSVTAATRGLLPEQPSDEPVFGTLRGGLVVLVDALTQATDAQLRLGVPVRQLRRTGTQWVVASGGPDATTHDTVDAVVLAVPPAAGRRLLGAAAADWASGVADAADAMAAVDTASMAVVALLLPPQTPLPEASGVLVGSGERRADGTPFTVKAVTYSARKWRHIGDRGALVRASVGRRGERQPLQATDDELVRLVRADLAELAGVDVEPRAVAVQRWGGGLPQYGVGHDELVRRIEGGVAAVPNLAIAGAALHGVGIPACIGTADRAARALVARLPVRN